MTARIALCLTVLNEGESITPLLESIARQTRLPDEVVIADGGSRDGTVAVLESWQDRLPIRVIRLSGAGISAGRNAAIAATDAPIVAVTDAGVRLSANWFADIVSPIENGSCDVVAGFFEADPQSTFEVAMGATVLPEAAEIVPATFLPSSRSIAFRRDVWEQIGGYPEWIDYCEDLLFDFAYRDAGFRQGWAPAAIAHFRPRSTIRSYWLQYYRYARGDGKADLWRKRHAARYLTYLVAGPVLAVAGLRFRIAWLLLAAGFADYLNTPLRRLTRQSAGLPLPERVAAFAWAPIIRIVGDVAKMAGYPVGLVWRWKHRHARPWLQ